MDPNAPIYIPSWMPKDQVAGVVESQTQTGVSSTTSGADNDFESTRPTTTEDRDGPTPAAQRQNEDSERHTDADPLAGGVTTLKVSERDDAAATPASAEERKPEADEVEDVDEAEAAAEERDDDEEKEEDEEEENGEQDGADGEQDGDTIFERVRANLEGRGDGMKHVNVVFIGHVDAGKSTISGHILYVTGGVDERTMEKYERESKLLNRESWKYAWALDVTEQERNKGKTEEVGRATFNTKTKVWTILDAPGHKNFVPHMIGGASQADVAILVISARKGEFETGYEKGGQTREHAMLAKTSGVRTLIVAVNKMDEKLTINDDDTWSKERYDEVQRKLMPYLKGVGWRPGDVVWLPLSGFTGENIKEPVDPKKAPWYEGESLLDTLEHLKPPERLINAPLRLPIFEKFTSMGTNVMGKVESGVIRENDKLLVMPSKMPVAVETIQLETGDDITVAEPGDNVRVKLKGVSEDEVKIGYLLCSPSEPVAGVTRFDVRLMILEHKSIITAGYSAILHVHAAVLECTIEKLLAVLDKKTGKMASLNPRFAKPGMNVVARLSVQQSVCIEPFKEFAQLGRFMLRDEGRTVAVGVVLKIRQAEALPGA